MRIFLSLFIVTFLSSSPINAKSSSPCWMVRIEKATPDVSMTGTGYIVSLNGSLYVRTASHVTLGDLSGVRLYDCQNRSLSYNSSGSGSNNALDDQLILLDDQLLSPLAVYNPALNLFLVTKSAYQEFIASARRVPLENPILPTRQNSIIAEDSFFSPLWIKRNNFRFREQKKNIMTWAGDDALEIFKGQSRSSEAENFLLADVSIIPGESGSPVIGWTPQASLEKEDLDLLGKVQTVAERYGFLDDQNQPIDVAQEKYLNTMVAYIKGHALAYHRSFLLSKFLSSKTFDQLHGSLTNADTSVTWRYQLGITYRTYQGPKLSVTELDDKKGFSGNGTSGNGGNGTSGNGGNGTSGNGGNGTSGNGGGNIQMPSLPSVGILFNGQAAISFRLNDHPELKLGANQALRPYFKAQAFIVADWDNFILLNTIQSYNQLPIYEVVYRTNDLQQYFIQRFNFVGSTGRVNPGLAKTAYSCRIDGSKLNQGLLGIQIRLGAIEGDEVIQFQSPIENFHNLQRLKSKSFGMIDVDFSGLFGLDLTFVGEKYRFEKDLPPFILIRPQGYAPEKYGCVLLM